MNQLVAFVCAVRTMSFTAAAGELGLSQPGVSDLISRLETELGEALFVRSGRSLTLSTAGRELYPYAKHAVEAAQNGAAAVQSLRTLRGGTATFGLSRNGPLYIGPGLGGRFHASYPDVRLRLVGQNSCETGDSVRNRDVEAGLVTLPIDEADLSIIQVARDEVFYVSAGTSTAPVGIAEVCSAPLVLYDAHYQQRDPARRQLAHRAAVAGLALKPQVEVEYLSDALDLTAAGVGSTVACGASLQAMVEPRGLTVRSFAEPFYDTLALIKSTDQPLSAATREIARLAMEALVERAADLPTVKLLPGSAQGAIDAFLGRVAIAS